MSNVSLAEFTATWSERAQHVPDWVIAAPLPTDPLGMRDRLETILDTVTALQRADWLEDGVYIGPTALPETYSELLHCAKVLQVVVPPAIAAGAPMSRQNAYGTDSRSFLYLSTYLMSGTKTPMKRFLLGRSLGRVAAQHVTITTLYSVINDQQGLRGIARKAVGPMVEFVMAPVSLGVRLALSRWHRAAELTADRAGLLCCDDLEAAGRSLLKQALGMNTDISHDQYLDRLKRSQERHSPGRWTQLLADRPWTHKRLAALQLFHDSQLYARTLGKEPSPDALDDDTLQQRTQTLLGLG